MSDDWRMLLHDAQVARKEVRFVDALQLCDRAGQMDINARYPAILLRGRLLFELGDTLGALSAYDSIADPSVDDPELDLARGIVLFHSVRLAEAEHALRSAVRGKPDLAQAYHMLGLLAELLATGEDVDLFRRARRLNPDLFAPVSQMTRTEFEALIDQSLQGLSPQAEARVTRLRIIVTEIPHPDDLRMIAPPVPPTALGMFVAHARNGSRSAEPAILLFKRNLERAFSNRDDLCAEIRKTVLREVAGFKPV